MPLNLRFWLVLVTATGTSVAGSPANSELDGAVILKAATPPRRQLIGDWQGQDALLVSLNRTWESELDTMLTSVSATTRVVLVLERGTSPAEAAGWLNERGLDAGRYEIVPGELNSPWVRDFAPFQTFEADGRLVWVDTVYGGDRPNDDALPRRLAQRWGIARVDFPERLDGGAVVANGNGLCVSTVEAFEDGGIGSAGSRQVSSLLDEIGCPIMVLVPALIYDKTKHADMFMQFVAADRVMIASLDHAIEPEDAWRMDVAAAAVQAGAARLGQTLHVTRVPMVTSEDGFYSTFINGLRLGNRFLVPTFDFAFGRPQDSAFAALRSAMPGVELRAIPADEMIRLNGALHCLGVGLALPAATPRSRSAHLRPSRGLRSPSDARSSRATRR